MQAITSGFSHALQHSNPLPEFSLTSDDFEDGKAIGADFDARAWQRIDDCYDRNEQVFHPIDADSETVVGLVHDICHAYNCPAALHGLLASLYLKHRARYLNSPEYYHFHDGQYSRVLPKDNAGASTGVMAYDYSNCTGEIVDIVNFSAIDPTQISTARHRPILHIWQYLKLDQELPLEIISYGAALLEVDICLNETLQANAKQLTPAIGLQQLSRCLLEFECCRGQIMPAIALAIHAAFLTRM